MAAAAPTVPQQQSQNNLTVAERCGAKTVKTTFTPSNLGSGSGAAPQDTDLAEAIHQLAIYVEASAECGSTILFARHNLAVVGLYSGAQVTKRATGLLLDSFAETEASALQICQPSDTALTVAGDIFSWLC